MGKLIIDGNSVYEVDEECMKRKEQEVRKKEEAEEEKKITGFSYQKKRLP